MELETKTNAKDVVTVDVHAAKRLLDSGHLYLDVRTTEEFNKSHIDKALNVPYLFKTQEGKVNNPEFLKLVASICKKDDDIVVGCNSGGRSFKACSDLLNEGFEKITNMEGGYNAWIDNNGLSKDQPTEALKTTCKFRN